MSEQEFQIGAKVRLVAQPPYFKTAEPMPMLRPPDVVKVGEEGTVRDRRPGGYWAVRFTRGAFLMDAQYIENIVNIASSNEEE
ncbi:MULTISPECIES: regulatory protein SipA [Spirulina sp. CCY15215]|uniref:regulatory protein SipA n=1 Tax=Spirulina sp. CCY15215 TaxID=2767591 RepID=UPI00194DED50|nr:DUF3148 domain-containing protein [Spirulina major]